MSHTNGFRAIFTAAVSACALILISGCARLPLTEKGLAVDKDTTVGIEDIGVASITKGF